jgi:hypothetical protein
MRSWELRIGLRYSFVHQTRLSGSGVRLSLCKGHMIDPVTTNRNAMTDVRRVVVWRTVVIESKAEQSRALHWSNALTTSGRSCEWSSVGIWWWYRWLDDGRKRDGWMTDHTEDGRNKGCSISQLCPRDCACLGVFEDLFPPRSDAGLFGITCCLFGWLQGCYNPTTPMCCVNSNILGASGISNSGFSVRYLFHGGCTNRRHCTMIQQ